MNDRLTLASLLLAGVVLGGCVSGARLGTARWSQFHADGPSQGWMAVPSTAAVPLVPKWSVDVGPAGYSSPVIGPEGTVYITTAAGEVVAVNPDGTIKWRRALPEPRLMSSAAVADDGHVYVISTRKIEGRFTSTLHKLTPEGAFVWESRLGDFGYTTGSPKVWRSNVFVHVRQSSVNFRHEVFVFDQAGTAVSREFAQLCEPEVVGTSDVVDWLSAFWDFLTDCLFGCYVRPSPDPLFQQFGWLDPTVAVIDFAGLEPSGQPLIVVVDNCGLIAFRWNTVNLTRVWAQESSYFDYSSPAVSGPLTIGRRDGRVVAYDYLTGVKLWEYDAGDTVMATPASIGRQIYAVSYEHLHVLDANGALVGKTALPGKTPFPLAAAPSASVASPALSANLVYVSSTGGLLAAAFDLSSYAAVTSIEGGLSSPAIAPDGTVYVVTRGGSLLAYPAP